jgi:hypothetical protein
MVPFEISDLIETLRTATQPAAALAAIHRFAYKHPDLQVILSNRQGALSLSSRFPLEWWVNGVTSQSSTLKSQSAFSRIAWHPTDPFCRNENALGPLAWIGKAGEATEPHNPFWEEDEKANSIRRSLTACGAIRQSKSVNRANS